MTQTIELEDLNSRGRYTSTDSALLRGKDRQFKLDQLVLQDGRTYKVTEAQDIVKLQEMSSESIVVKLNSGSSFILQERCVLSKIM